MKTEAEVRATIEYVITRAFRAAPVEWRREMTLCLFYAAVENPVLRVDHVWEVFYRRGSGIKYPKPYGMGRVMRLGLDFGWIRPVDKPMGTGRIRSNHNDRGTLTYRSEIFDPGKKVDSCLGGIPTMQLDLPMLSAA